MKFGIAGSILITFLLIAGLQSEANACECAVLSRCSSYSWAAGVYKGKLIRIEKDNSQRSPRINFYFDVYHTYKGRAEKIVKLVYHDTECGPNFIVGGDYLIYKEPNEVQR